MRHTGTKAIAGSRSVLSNPDDPFCRYGGYNVGAEIAAGRMKALSEPFMAFEFDLNNVAKPASLSRAERLEALTQCEAAAHPEYDSEAPDPENIWGPLKSPMGQEALAEGDPAFKNGEMVLALQCYQKVSATRFCVSCEKLTRGAWRRRSGWSRSTSRHRRG